MADHGYAIHAFRDLIWNQGARPAIPAKRNEVDVAYPLWIYHNLNRVEWGAARFDETAGCGRGHRNRRSDRWTRTTATSPWGAGGRPER